MNLASSLLVVLTVASPCFASRDSDQTASDVSAVTALSAVAVPICVGAAGAYVGTGLAVGSEVETETDTVDSKERLR